MRAWRILLVGLLAFSCWRATTAHADAIGPAPACPAGQTRYGLGGGFFGHGGGPRCEPATCTSSEGCGEGGPCVRYAHCLADRTVEERVPPPHRDGRGGGGLPAERLDPLAPGATRTVLRTIDLGACDAEGHCEAPDAHCRMIALCGPEEPPGAFGRMVTGAAWHGATDFDATLPLGPLAASAPTEPVASPPSTPPDPATEEAATSSPETPPSAAGPTAAPAAGGLCAVDARGSPRLALLLVSAACALASRSRRARRIGAR